MRGIEKSLEMNTVQEVQGGLQSLWAPEAVDSSHFADFRASFSGQWQWLPVHCGFFFFFKFKKKKVPNSQWLDLKIFFLWGGFGCLFSSNSVQCDGLSSCCTMAENCHSQPVYHCLKRKQHEFYLYWVPGLGKPPDYSGFVETWPHHKSRHIWTIKTVC